MNFNREGYKTFESLGGCVVSGRAILKAIFNFPINPLHDGEKRGVERLMDKHEALAGLNGAGLARVAPELAKFLLPPLPSDK